MSRLDQAFCWTETMTWGEEEVFHQIKVSDTDLTLWCAACRALSTYTYNAMAHVQSYTHTVIHMSHSGGLSSHTFPSLSEAGSRKSQFWAKEASTDKFPMSFSHFSCNYQISLITIVGTPSPNYPLTLLSLYKILINHLCSSHISLCVLVEIVISTLLCLTLFLRRN